MSVNSTQVGGAHYNGVELQHWDYVIQCLEGRYLEGNISKYVFRHRRKNGSQDLHKALHYLEKLRESHDLKLVRPLGYNSEFTGGFDLREFFDANNCTPIEVLVLRTLTCWQGDYDLREVEKYIKEALSFSEARDRVMQARKAGAAPVPSHAEQEGFPGSDYVNQG